MYLVHPYRKTSSYATAYSYLETAATLASLYLTLANYQ